MGVISTDHVAYVKGTKEKTAMSEAAERIYLNGVDGVTGDYLVQPMSTAEAAAIARGKPEDSGLNGWMKSIWEAMQRPSSRRS